MKTFFTLLLAAFVSFVTAQDFYNLETIQTIEVTFSESNWDQLMDAAYAAETGYILAESIAINGVVYDSIGVKYKGNSSYQTNQVKNPWHIELDTYKDQDYDGYTDIKLANGAKDPSMIRDALGYQIIGQYMVAPKANFANLYVNGDYIGLYTNTESISKKFMADRFGSKNNTRVKCSPPDGAGPQSSDLPNLVYLGQDSTDYYDAYEVQSDAGWQDLVNLCDTLENHTADIEAILDVDRALWMLALNNVIVNLDSYIGNFAQNYYLYKSDDGQFLPVMWDLNESFGVFSQTGTSNLNGTAAKQTMNYLLHENDSDYPLIQNLLDVPMYKRMYLAHFKTILLENFDNGTYAETGAALQSIIDEAVQSDDNKFYTYANFLSNLDSDIGGGGGGPGGGNSAPGITNLMDSRSAYLLGLSDFAAPEPSITDINLSDDSPMINSSITITATVTDGASVLLGYRNSAVTAPFTKVEMFDDGAHNDGAMGDGIYGVELAINDKDTEYYIYAENATIGMFSPRRAEYEYHTINAMSGLVTGDIVINEFMASNDITMADQDGDFDDWIELYNLGTETVDIGGYALSDDTEVLNKWTFPEGTLIEPDGYLIIWADEDLDQDGLHANFKLSAGGESVILSDADLLILDEVDYTDQTADVSYARIPNGTGDFENAFPTFASNNNDTIDCSAQGGDMDNDGICAMEDCDDNNASIGAAQEVGTACDDSDPTTQGDVIQSDGCTCLGTVITVSDAVINEFMASNEMTMADQDGEFDDWIELYNNGTEQIDLSGYFLSDDPGDIAKWEFPVGTFIDAGGYLIVWADEDLDQEGLHADFKLSAGGESVILSRPGDMSIVDAIDYSDQEPDSSYGRFPNGTGNFQTMDPTFNAMNSGMTSTDDQLEANVRMLMYPNPATNFITIVFSKDLPQDRIVTIHNSTGQMIYKGAVSTSVTINTIDWVQGMYIVKTEGVVGKLFVE